MPRDRNRTPDVSQICQCLLALDRNNKDEARRAFVTARDFAKRQGAILFERRAEAALCLDVGAPAIDERLSEHTGLPGTQRAR